MKNSYYVLEEKTHRVLYIDLLEKNKWVNLYSEFQYKEDYNTIRKTIPLKILKKKQD